MGNVAQVGAEVEEGMKFWRMEKTELYQRVKAEGERGLMPK